MTPLRILLGLLLALVAFSCLEKDEELEEKEFFTVRTGEVRSDSLSIGTVRLLGEITGATDFSRYGFYFGSERNSVEDTLATALVSLPLPATTVFSFETLPLLVGRWYFYRAFAVQGPRAVLGAVDSFQLGFTQVARPIGPRRNDSLDVQLLTTNDRSYTINSRGYRLYRETASGLEQIGEAVELPNRDDNTATINFPSFNTRYFLEPYLIGAEEYRGEQLEVLVTDGWRPAAPFPLAVERATVVTYRDTLFISGGCLNAGCGQARPTRMLGIAGVTQLGGAALAWEDFSQRLPAPIVANLSETVAGVAGAVGDTWVQGFGTVNPDDANGFVYIYRRLSPELRVEGTGFGLQDGVGFTLGNEFYVGSGSITTTGRGEDAVTSQNFYRISENGTATRVASLPVRTETGDVNRPRSFAVSVKSGNQWLVGAGIGGDYLNDFYEFLPPAPGTDRGGWRYAASLPARGREGAISFSASGRGFVGMGLDRFGEFLNDLYEYAPQAGTFIPRQPLPGNPRAYGIGFSLGSQGCVCGGRIRNNLPGTDRITLTADCWRYIPSTYD